MKNAVFCDVTSCYSTWRNIPEDGILQATAVKTSNLTSMDISLVRYEHHLHIIK
jgi:hypothetical protein